MILLLITVSTRGDCGYCFFIIEVDTMPVNRNCQDCHDAILTVGKDVEYIKESINEIKAGNGASCTKHSARIDNHDKQLKGLWGVFIFIVTPIAAACLKIIFHF